MSDKVKSIIGLVMILIGAIISAAVIAFGLVGTIGIIVVSTGTTILCAGMSLWILNHKEAYVGTTELDIRAGIK